MKQSVFRAQFNIELQYNRVLTKAKLLHYTVVYTRLAPSTLRESRAGV